MEGMRRPGPLPSVLHGTEFTRAQALEAGITAQRLRARDIERVARNVYRMTGCAEGLEIRARALSSANPEAWVSHQSAAALHGLWVPSSYNLAGSIHLSRSHRHPAVRQPGITGHSMRAREGEVIRVSGIRVSSPARAWLDLARDLSVEDLIVIGDQLLRVPRVAFEGRAEPWATRGSMAAMLLLHPNFQGIVRARAALELMRVGADSPPETRLRLAMMHWGLPEPELQVRTDPDDPWSPPADLGYRRWKIAIQYDGAVHLTVEQQSRDNLRDEVFNVAGWSYFKFNKQDLLNGFARASNKIHLAIARRVA